MTTSAGSCGHRTCTATRAISGTTELTSWRDAARGAPRHRDAGDEGMDEYEDDNYMNGQIEDEQVRA